ncbi:MAG: hypothetical protein M3256_27960 [Actinomycetota bacterium]|nr:hypothetical protein [Actinomycetota bacterium]
MVLDLDYGFHVTQDRRYTLGRPLAPKSSIALDLSHERYAEEVAAGLHDIKKTTVPIARIANQSRRPRPHEPKTTG